MRVNGFYIACCLVGLIGFGSVSADWETDREYIAELLAGGRFQEAEIVCREKLNDSSLGESATAAYTCELLRVITEQARRSGTNADRLWSVTEQIAKDYLQDYAKSPRAVLVQLQAALTDLARANQLSGSSSEDDVSELRQLARRAGRDLEKLGQKMDERLRGSQSDPNEDGYLSRKQLRAVRGSIKQQRARALLLLAETAPSADDRALLANDARLELERIAPGDVSEPAWWRSRVTMITCHRFNEEWTSAAKLIEELQSAPSASELAPLVQAEELQIELAQQRWQAVRSRLSAARGDTSPELALARFKAMLALADEAERNGNTELSQTFQSRAADTLPKIETKFGSHWRKRAERYLTTHQPAAGAQSELVSAVARNLLQQGKTEEAVNKLIEAAQLAAANGQPDAAHQLGSQAAALARHAQRWQLARDGYLRVSRDWSAAPSQAATAHRMAIQCAAQLAKVGDSLDAYRDLLDEHLKRWPDARTVGPAKWRARLAEREGDWLTAARLYGVELARSDAPEIVDDVQRSLERAQVSSIAVESLQGQVVDVLLGQYESEPDVPWRLDAAADLLLMPFPVALESRYSHELTRQLQAARRETWMTTIATLTRALQAAKQTAASDAEWNRYAAALVVLHGMSQDERKATALVSQLRLPMQPGLVLQTMSRLGAHVAEPALRSKLQLAVADVLPREVQTFERDIDRYRFDKLRTGALLDAGQADVALEVARRCVHSDDAESRVLLAECLSASTSESALREALALWHTIENEAAVESSLWYTAKLRMVDALVRLHETDRAHKSLRLLKALHPTLGGAEMSGRFERLLEKCRRDSDASERTLAPP